MSFEIVAKSSGLTMEELAFVYGYSRQTLYNWLKGKTPRGAHSAAVETYTRLLQKAIESGVLPLKDNNPSAREHKVVAIKRNLYLAAVPK